MVLVDVTTVLAATFAIFGFISLTVRASVFFISAMAGLCGGIVSDKTTVAKGEPFVFCNGLHEFFAIGYSVVMIGIVVEINVESFFAYVLIGFAMKMGNVFTADV